LEPDFAEMVFVKYFTRRVWRYQRGNQNPYIEEWQTTQWQKRTSNDLQNTTQKTKDQVTRIPQKNGDELMCTGRIGSSCYTSGTRGVTNSMISHEW